MLHTGRLSGPSEMADRLAIQDVLAVHCRGVDRADEAALKSAYWDDAEVAYGGFEGSAHEFCEILPTSIVRFAHTQHSISNVLIRFAEPAQIDSVQVVASAAVETYVTAYHYLAEAGDAEQEMTFLGRYLDRFERRGDSWKIAHRRVLMDWNQNAAGTAVWEGPPFDGLARGARAPQDPVYPLFAAVAAAGTNERPG